jgi:hypothetical protein
MAGCCRQQVEELPPLLLLHVAQDPVQRERLTTLDRLRCRPAARPVAAAQYHAAAHMLQTLLLSGLQLCWDVVPQRGRAAAREADLISHRVQAQAEWTATMHAPCDRGKSSLQLYILQWLTWVSMSSTSAAVACPGAAPMCSVHVTSPNFSVSPLRTPYRAPGGMVIDAESWMTHVCEVQQCW